MILFLFSKICPQDLIDSGLTRSISGTWSSLLLGIFEIPGGCWSRYWTISSKRRPARTHYLWMPPLGGNKTHQRVTAISNTNISSSWITVTWLSDFTSEMKMEEISSLKKDNGFPRLSNTALPMPEYNSSSKDVSTYMSLKVPTILRGSLTSSAFRCGLRLHSFYY